MSKKLLISPSGNFYGSEQVLFDYLNITNHSWKIALPGHSILYYKLFEYYGDKFTYWTFNERYTKLFQFFVLLKLLFFNYKILYFNEAGYSRFACLIAKMFPNLKVVVHVRILEDTFNDRWRCKNLPQNLTLIAISKFIKKNLAYPSVLIYDLYPFDHFESSGSVIEENHTCRVGVIGRITHTKGSHLIKEVAREFRAKSDKRKVKFFLFGHFSKDMHEKDIYLGDDYASIEVMGFEPDKSKMYSQIDIVLHLNNNEPLGRIYLEAINYLKPFVGFNSGGIHEIGSLGEIDFNLIDDDVFIPAKFASKIIEIINNYSKAVEHTQKAKDRLKNIFSPQRYSDLLEETIGPKKATI